MSLVYLDKAFVIKLNQLEMVRHGGRHQVLDNGLLESAVVQPQHSFEGCELYPTIASKAAALAFSLIRNHPFADGNKRTAHLALVTFLDLNGFNLIADFDEQERTILRVACGKESLDGFAAWIDKHLAPR